MESINKHRKQLPTTIRATEPDIRHACRWTTPSAVTQSSMAVRREGVTDGGEGEGGGGELRG
eukprot:scaffold17075_cov66-Phaeocystis_antarctica.AAC.1